jgi:hypothetical protein
VKKRSRDQEGELIGRSNSNPLLDSSMYEVQFEDGSVDRYHANIIAENIYSRVDSAGNSQYMLDEILDHQSDDTAIKQSEGFTVGSKGEQVPKQTTRGWKLLVRQKGSQHKLVQA